MSDASDEARPVCADTGKRCYPSERAARAAMRKLSARLRAYRCPHCKKIHLTKERDPNWRGRR